MPSRRRAQEDREGAIALGLDFLAGLEEVTFFDRFFDDDDSDNGVYESMPLDQDIFSGSLWISRCGVVRPASEGASQTSPSRSVYAKKPTVQLV